MPTLRHIKETCLYVSDLALCRSFYHGVLQLPVISEKPGRHIFFRVGPDVLLCFLPEATRAETTLPAHFASGQQHFALECEAAEYGAWKAYLAEKQIAVESEQDWGRGIKSFYFRDPFGHSVEICMPGLWG